MGSDTLCAFLSAKKWNSEDPTDFECAAKLWEVSKISIQSGPSNAHNPLHYAYVRGVGHRGLRCVISDRDRDIHQFELFSVFGM